MPDIATTVVTPLLAAGSEQQGPGDTLRVVLLVSLVGAALLAWFLLRGYRGAGEDTETDGSGEPGTRESEGHSATSPTRGERPGGDTATTAARTENGPGDANA